MKREEIRSWLSGLDLDDRLPLWVISYNRAGKAPLLDALHGGSKTDDINVVVRKSQGDDYRRAYPKFQIYALPDEAIRNVGRARWAAAELAYGLGEDEILMADDDLNSLHFLFERTMVRGKNAGAPCSGHSTKEDEAALDDLPNRVLAGLGAVAREVFAVEPRAVLGSAIRRNMCFAVQNHRTKYLRNGGATPRALAAWNLARMDELGIELNVDLFGEHGDDIGLVAEVLAKGGDCFSMPSFAYGHWAESENIELSVIRTRETAPKLHRDEYAALQTYPIRDYLREKRSILDGSYEWGEVDWRKYGKLTGRPMKRVLWPSDEPSEDDLL